MVAPPVRHYPFLPFFGAKKQYFQSNYNGLYLAHAKK